MRSFAALSIVLLTTSSSASSVINIPLTKLQRTGTYLKGSPDADRARAAFLKLRTASGPTTVPATNLAYVQYTTSVGIGNPPTYYNLVVDTGSSNTFCGTGTPYVRTSTSIPTGEAVNVTYGSGYFSGLEYLDQVTLAANLVITNQSIGDALSYADFQGVDGIVGVGPVDLTLGTLSPDTNAAIPTVMNNLVSQGLIENQPRSYSDTNGALTYGGIDSGLLTYVPVTMTYPAAYYWGINVTSSAYGTHTVIPTSTAGIVDTGTTQVLLADDFFAVYLKAIPGANLSNFTIADRVFSMDVAAQLIPTDQNTAWGGVSGKQYGVVANLGSNSGEGLDFIIGQKFMERYYAVSSSSPPGIHKLTLGQVFDTDANRVGFAQT
ncbi:acid protease [Boletus edulis]|nr:acid protease [Boletus edulis]